jgi:hypothetical protein
MKWILVDPSVDLGFLPNLISEHDPRPVGQQLAETYAHGGGWNPQSGFRKTANYVLHYPGDPPMRPLAMTTLRDEMICFYPYSYLGVFKSDGSFEVSRVD